MQKAREQEAHGWTLGFGFAERGSFCSGSWFAMVRPSQLIILVLTVHSLSPIEGVFIVHFSTPLLFSTSTEIQEAGVKGLFYMSPR